MAKHVGSDREIKTSLSAQISKERIHVLPCHWSTTRA
jgi:hypothetical protein